MSAASNGSGEDVLERAFQAVRAVNDPTTHTDARSAAQQWLEKLGERDDAWRIADEFLALDGSPDNYHFLFHGANMMHEKIRSEFDSLPEASIPSLREALVKHVYRFREGPRAVFRRVALCMDALAVRWSAWSDVVPSIVSAFQMGQDSLPTEAVPCVLEIFTHLPSECWDKQVDVPRERRVMLSKEMEASADTVCQFLSYSVELTQEMEGSGREMMANSILECLDNWISFCRLPAELVAHHNLLELAFSSLPEPVFFENSLKALISAVQTYSDITHDYAVIRRLMPRVLSLQGALDELAADAADVSMAAGLCELVVATGLSYAPMLLSSTDVSQEPFFRLMLRCTAQPAFEVSSRTIRFWRAIADQFYDERAEKEEHPAETLMYHVFMDLGKAILAALEFPEDFDSLPPDKQEDFEGVYRYDIADLLLDVCDISGWETTLSTLGSQLHGQLETFHSTEGAGSHASTAPDAPTRCVGTWVGIEAALYAVRAIGRRVPPDEGSVLPALLGSLPSFPAEPPRLKATLLRVMGRYAGWMSMHPETLQPLFGLAVEWMRHPAAEFVEQGGLALQDLLRKCGHLVGTEGLEQVASVVEQLPPEDAENVFRGMGAACQALLGDHGPGAVESALRETMRPTVARLAGLVESPDQLVDESHRWRDVVTRARPRTRRSDLQGETTTAFVRHLVARLRAVIRGTHRCEPLLGILQELWPLLRRVTELCASQESIVEAIASLYAVCLKRCGIQMQALVPDLAEEVATRFQEHPFSAYLYVTSELWDVFGEAPDDRVSGALHALLTTLTHVSFDRLSQGPSATGRDPFEENPCLVEDLFALLTHVVDTKPDDFLAWEYFSPSLECALRSLFHAERKMNTVVLFFLERVLHAPLIGVDVAAHVRDARASRLQASVQRDGWMARLVWCLLEAAAGALPADRIDEPDGCIAFVLFELRRLRPEACRASLDDAIGASGLIGRALASPTDQAAMRDRILHADRAIPADRRHDEEDTMADQLHRLRRKCKGVRKEMERQGHKNGVWTRTPSAPVPAAFSTPFPSV